MVSKGVPIREAHSIVGRTVLYAIEKGKALEDLSVDEFEQFAKVIGGDVYEALELSNIIKKRDVIGGVAFIQTEADIVALTAKVKARM